VTGEEGGTMVKVLGNRESCRGYGNCLIAAPAVFDVDEQGLVVVLKDEVADDELGPVERAAYDCPTNSITLTANSERGAE
jgi:ferredoxin